MGGVSRAAKEVFGVVWDRAAFWALWAILVWLDTVHVLHKVGAVP